MSWSTYWRSKQGGTVYMSTKTCHTRFKCPSGKKKKKNNLIEIKNCISKRDLHDQNKNNKK